MKELDEAGKLFIGNREDAFSCLTEDSDITHILTIESEPLSDTEMFDKGRGFEIALKHIECLDNLSADLLVHFDDCIKFINSGIASGKVLVHW